MQTGGQAPQSADLRLRGPVVTVARRRLDDVSIPAPLWWSVATMAEALGESTEQFIHRTLTAAVRPETDGTATVPLPDAVHGRWACGDSDREIGARLSITNEKVARIRQSLGLPANRKRRTA